MEIIMDFNKPSISKKIQKFLIENLKTEKERESLTNVITGKSVLKGDAITLLLSLVQAMTLAVDPRWSSGISRQLNLDRG